MGAIETRWGRAICAPLLCLLPAFQPPQQARSEAGPTAAWDKTHFSTREGLPQNWITALVQARDGYLWIGTQGGLARFDGTRFRIFDMASTPALGCNRILSLIESSTGELWIGTTSAGVVRVREGRFSSLSDEPGAPVGSVPEIREDATGALWFAGSQLTRYRNGAFERFGIGDAPPGAIGVRSLHLDPEGTLWATTPLGIAHFDGEVWDLLESPPGRSRPLLMGESARGTWVIGRDWIGYRNGERFEAAALTGKVPARVSSSLIDRVGRVWISAEKGLFLLKESEPEGAPGQVEFLAAEPNRKVNGTAFGALLEDDEGNLWVGLDGLTRVRARPYRALALPLDLRFEGAAIATMGGVEGAWAANPGLWREVRGAWNPFEPWGSRGRISTLIPARSGGLWITSSGSLLTRLAEGKLVDFPHDLGAVYCTREGPGGSLWLMSSSGLSSFSDGEFTRYSMGSAPSQPDSRPVAMGWTRDDTLWVGWKGAAMARSASGATQYFTPAEGLPDAELRAIHETADGAVWIATYGTGLARYLDGEFALLTTRDGLPDNSLGAILEDGSRNLWINSNRGVFRARIDDLNAALDGRSTLVPTRLFTHEEGDGTAGGKTSDGRLWFRSTNSIDVIDPDRRETSRVPPRLALERISANGRELEPGTPLRISAGRGDLYIEFAVLNFTDPERVRVRYRLAGHDELWIESPGARSAHYTNVPPGDYQFQLAACSDGGSWSDAELALDLELSPFFWQTPWFAGLAGLVLIGAVVAVHRYQTRVIRAHNATLLTEIGRRQQVEVTLREQEERLQVALSSAEMGTWRWDPVLDQSTIDASMGRMHGLPAEDVTVPTQVLLERVHPDDLPRAREAFARAVEEHADFVREFRIVRPDGEVHWHRDRGRPHFHSNGELAYVTGASVDITERKLAEVQRLELEDNLRHRHKMEAIGQLASGVAHEFNNLLVGILCNTDLLLEANKRSLDDVSKKRIRDIDRCGERAASLTHKLLSFAKRDTPRNTVFDLNEVVVDAESMLRGILGERIELTLELGTGLPPVLCDKTHMEQGLLNLIINARDAVAGEGRVTVQTTGVEIDAAGATRNPDAREGVHTVLRVTDTGCGMSEQTRERIFEPFFTTKPTGEGTGLGLSTLFADVSNAGGHVTVESREHQGATFRVFLPAGQVDHGHVVDTGRATETRASRQETVLVCDTDERTLFSLTAVLEEQGFRVLEAWSPAEARALALEHPHPIDLLLVDVAMPDSEGPQLARDLLPLHPAMEVLFMSAYPADVLRVEGREFEFLRKPPTRASVLRRVREVLAHRHGTHPVEL